MQVAKAVNNQLVFVNHSVNFFLYCITGQRFRRVIVSLCRDAADSDSRSDLHRRRGDGCSPSNVRETTALQVKRSRPTTHRAGSTRDDGLPKRHRIGRDVVVVELAAGATTSSSNGPPAESAVSTRCRPRLTQSTDDDDDSYVEDVHPVD